MFRHFFVDGSKNLFVCILGLNKQTNTSTTRKKRMREGDPVKKCI